MKPKRMPDQTQLLPCYYCGTTTPQYYDDVDTGICQRHARQALEQHL